MTVNILVQKCAIKGVGSTQGYPKRFVKVDISKKYSDAIFRIIWFFTVKMTPGPNNNMLGCLKWYHGIAKVHFERMDMRAAPRLPVKMQGSVLGALHDDVCLL